MPERQPVPWLIFLILVVLTAGAAATGLVLAPPAADLVVQNAAGENLSASTLDVTLILTRTDQSQGRSVSAQPLHADLVIHPGAVVNTQTPVGQETAFVLFGLKRISTHTPWVADGANYRYTRSLAVLLGLPTTLATAPGKSIPITVTGISRVWVSGGYLAGFTVHLRESANGGKESTSTVQIVRFRQIDGYTPDLSQVPANT